MKKIFLAIVLICLVAAGAGSVAFNSSNGVFSISHENGKKQTIMVDGQGQAMFRLLIEDTKNKIIDVQEYVDLITVQKSEKITIIARKGYGSMSQVKSKKVLVYNCLTGQTDAAGGPPDILVFDGAKDVRQVVTSELMFLSIKRSEKIDLDLKAAVDVIEVEGSHDVHILAEGGYGYSEVKNSKKVVIEGQMTGSSSMNIVTSAAFSNAGYTGTALVSSGSISYTDTTNGRSTSVVVSAGTCGSSGDDDDDDDKGKDRDKEKDGCKEGSGHSGSKRSTPTQQQDSLQQQNSFSMAGSFNLAEQVTVWNNATVTQQTFLQTGDVTSASSTSAQGTGFSFSQVLNDNFLSQQQATNLNSSRSNNY